MAYRNNRSKRSSFRASDYVPIWTQQQTDTTTLMAQMMLESLGVTDVASYFQKLQIPIVLCVVVGAVWGLTSGGLWGFIWGVLAGVLAPAFLVCFGAVISYAAIYLLVFFLAWAVIIFGIFWLISL